MPGRKRRGGDTFDSGKVHRESSDSKETSHVPSVQKVQRDQNVQSKESDRYRTDFPRMGRCLIINNKTFYPETGLVERTGSEFDVADARGTFESLGYEVEVKNDLTAEKMIQALEEVSQMDHSENASFVCVILSHGKDEEIYGVDKPVELEELTEHLKGKEGKCLFGKPKLFFIQACRGLKEDEGVTGDVFDSVMPTTTRKMPTTTRKIPVEADFLYAYATPLGYRAWRNIYQGSWFIQALCEMIKKHKDLELMRILTRVNRRVAYDKETWRGYKQIPSIVSMLTKEFYFSKS